MPYAADGARTRPGRQELVASHSAALGSAPPAAAPARLFYTGAVTALDAPAPPATLLALLQALASGGALAAGAPCGAQAPPFAGGGGSAACAPAAAAPASPADSSDDNSASDAAAKLPAAALASAARGKRRLTDAQESLLYASFASGPRLTRERKAALAAATRLAPRQVEVWFQNRRARGKAKDAAARCATLEAELAALRAENAAVRDAGAALAATMAAMQRGAGGPLAAEGVAQAVAVCVAAPDAAVPAAA